MKTHELIHQDQGIWDNFCRKEEYGSKISDRYDRFPYYASECRNIFEPHVSKYLHEQGYHVEYPENKPFAVCLTHDIDEVYSPIGGKSIAALRQLRDARYSECIHSLGAMRSRKMPLWNFSRIMAVEEAYGARSSFFFMVQDPGSRDFAYRIEDCEEIIKELSDRGWDVGLHGGCTAYNDPVEMSEKKARLEHVLGKKVVGYRNHYIRMRVPDTWEHIANAGFEYDTTLGYADCIGFRNGMCHPFRPFNLRTGEEIDIFEIPLAIMDTTLFFRMHMDFQRAWALTEQIIDTVERYHGVLTVLWHNTHFSGDMARFFEKILRYCAEKNAWMTSGADICKWVTEHRSWSS